MSKIQFSLLLAGLLSCSSATANSQNLAESLMKLRGDVERLDSSIVSEKESYTASIRSLHRQKDDLTSVVAREELSIKQTRQELDKVRKEIKEASKNSEGLKPLLVDAIEKLRQNIKNSLPFKTNERLADIDKIEEQIKTDLVTPQKLSGRVVSGAGSVVVEVNSDSSTDFSTALALDTAANETIEFRGDSTFDGNFGDANIVVSSGVTLTTTFDRLDGKTTALSGAGNITLSDTSVDAADANDVAGAISGVLSATVSPDTAANLNAALTDANATDALDIVITGTTAIASDLKELDAKTSLEIDAATNVETITGVAEDIQTVVEAAGIDTATNVNVVVDSGDATVVQQVAIDAQTTGVITATISNGDMASLSDITASDATHNLTITVTDTSVAASELIALDTKTNVAIQTAVDVDELTGTRENISTVINSATITTATDVNATVSGSMTSTQLATMDGITTGVITATISDNDMTALANLTNDNANNALTIIVTDASVDATALNTLTTKTSEVITATAVGTLTGTAAAVEDALTSSEVDLATDIAIDINSGTATVTEQIAIDAQTTGVITATISNGDMASLSDITASDATHNLTITVTDTSVAASELIALDTKTNVAIQTAVDVDELTGTRENISTVINSATITTATDVNATVSGSMTSTQLATMDGITTGVITATISDNDMTALANLTNDNANNALTIIVTDASVDATALNTLTTKTSEVITATAVGTLTGTAAAVEDALTSSEVDLATDIAIDINSGTATVTEQIAIDAQTTGVITATISNGDMASLSDITASDATHNLTITVTDTSVAASELLTLDNKTSVAINALGVTTLSGTLAAINSVLSAAGIDTVTNSTLTVEISDSTLSAQELLDLEQESAVGTVDASSIDTISATVAQLNTLYGNTDIINLGDDTANITTAGTFAPTEFGNIESGDITTLIFSDSTDTLAFTDESSFDDFRAKFSTIDLGSSSDDTLSFSSAVGASGNLADLDFSNISDLENLDFSGSDDYISLSGDEPSNIDLGDGDDVVELSFSELSNFTIDGGVGSDRVNLTGDSQTVNDTDFANLANIEALDFEGSANNIIIDAATINDWLDGSGTFTIKGADDDTLNISTDDANYRWFDSSDSTWKDTDLNDVAPATYQIDTNNDDSANFTLEKEAS